MNKTLLNPNFIVAPTATDSPVTSTFSCLKRYGVNRRIARYLIHNLWEVPTSHRDIFKTYFMRHWEPDYFSKVALVEGTITDNGTVYQVIYHRCNSVDVAKSKYKLALSFRNLQPEFEAFPTVLVTIANGKKWSRRS